MKNYFEQNLHYEKDQRSFKKRSSIPEPLKCSICFDVFHQPIRLFCWYIIPHSAILSAFSVSREF